MPPGVPSRRHRGGARRRGPGCRRAEVGVDDALHPARRSLASATARRSSIRPSAAPRRRRRPRAPRPPPRATAPDARPDRRRRGRLAEELDGALEDAAGKAAPAAVEHRDPAATREGDRQAVGHEHEQAEVAVGGGVAVDPGQLGPRVGVAVTAGGRRPGPGGDPDAVLLPAHGDARRGPARSSSAAAPVLRHPPSRHR